ncbi:transglutaminase-like domain-containing protein [Caldimonas brevitalea]|uniref:Transglutaminase n=1 Tax=Caldimonas brevitalea TaxID=413882 RepID=A0A0G3BLZ3_9BURK|nr:transglutaminase domain-containing protein [Caldimonas brevitalea]AKJ28376.1 transglutaminase [Caldimonas brevitalea]
MNTYSRRAFLQAAGLAAAAHAMPLRAEERRFAPSPGRWRNFELTTRVDLLNPEGLTRVWLPVPSLDETYQRSLGHEWQGNATKIELRSDQRYGARVLYAEFAAGTPAPALELRSRVATRDRAVDWDRASGARVDPALQRTWTEATELMPTDGIVLQTAREITQGARRDLDKVRRIFDWVVHTTYREPTVRGCGVGDIQSMLETGNFGGKCGDINALFVGLCRAVGVPARDVYGIRLAPSAFGYRELGGNPANLKSAQHCRAEVFLKGYGWVAMDPADVGKVMRLETGQWVKDTSHPVVAPVHRGLFGGWEGNWLGYNMAHDVALPGSGGPKLGFLMYPQAENAGGRYDPLDPDRFKYTITSRELA